MAGCRVRHRPPVPRFFDFVVCSGVTFADADWEFSRDSVFVMIGSVPPKGLLDAFGISTSTQ